MSAEQRRNIWLLGLDMAIFSMELGALGQLTVIPLFVSKLTENPLAIVAPLLDWYPFPYNFAASFGIAAAIYAAGLIPLYLVREAPGPPPRPPRPFREQLGELPGVLREDAPFRRFLLGLCVAPLATMSSGFLVVYAVQVLGAADDMAGWYTACPFIAQMASSTLLGWLGDRYGSTWVGRAMGLSTIGACAVALLAMSAVWLLASVLVLGDGARARPR